MILDTVSTIMDNMHLRIYLTTVLYKQKLENYVTPANILLDSSKHTS
jgi:hypothetical protein